MNYKDKPIILQVLPSLISGGVERGTIEIATALSENKYISYVASNGGGLVSKLDELHVHHFTLPLHSKNPFIMYKNIRSLISITKKYKIDIIHARSRAPAWSCYFAAKITGCKFITTFHGMYNYKNFLKKFYNSVMTKSDKIIAVSTHVANHIKENYHKDSKVIHRGADLDYFNPFNITQEEIDQLKSEFQLGEKLPIIILPGRITRWKGHIYLVEAIKQLPFKAYCLFVGDDKSNSNYRNELISLIEKYNLGPYIKLVSNQKNMPLIYSLADIVVSASTEPEAFGRVVIEAQAMKCLTIATNIGGACETIIDGKTGWLIPPADSQKLAEKLEQIINLTLVEKSLVTEAARKNIEENFSLEKMINKTLEVYNQVNLSQYNS